MSEAEENQIVQHVRERVSIGCGVDFNQLCLLIQECVGALKVSNPDRQFPSSWESNYPDESFVRRLCKRNGLKLRATMELSTARAMLTVHDLDKWFGDVEEGFVKNPKFAECFSDPSRIYNVDETPITWGNQHQKVRSQSYGPKIFLPPSLSPSHGCIFCQKFLKSPNRKIALKQLSEEEKRL